MCLGMMPVVKALVLLAIAFFVAVTAQKVKPKKLQLSANFLAITMCIVAGIIIVGSMYKSAVCKPGMSLKAKCPIMKSMCRR